MQLKKEEKKNKLYLLALMAATNQGASFDPEKERFIKEEVRKIDAERAFRILVRKVRQKYQ